jgi:hypothetical protein
MSNMYPPPRDIDLTVPKSKRRQHRSQSRAGIGDRLARNCPFVRPGGDRPQYFDCLERDENLLSVVAAISAVTAAEDLTRIKFSTGYFTDDREISQDFTGYAAVQARYYLVLNISFLCLVFAACCVERSGHKIPSPLFNII